MSQEQNPVSQRGPEPATDVAVENVDSARKSTSMPLDENKTCNLKQQKRILITNVNSLLGQSCFEAMRNDHLLLEKDD